MENTRVGVDDQHELLRDPRRRYALYYFLSNDYMNIDTLALQIAAWEEGETVGTVSETAQQSVKVALHHLHLPKLAEHDVVEYDVRSGDVVVAEGFDDVRAYVEQCRTREEMKTGETGRSSHDEGNQGPILRP